MSVAVASVLGFIVSVVAIVHFKLVNVPTLTKEEEDRAFLRKPSLGWSIFFAALQAFLSVYAALGYVQDDPVSAIIMNVVLCLCVFACMNRPAIAKKLLDFTGPEGHFRHPTVVMVLLMCLAGLFAGLALEVPSNHDFSWVYPLCMLLEWGLITVTMGGLFFLFQRRSAPCSIVVIALYVIGLAEYFVITFRSMPITPGDLTALSTAAAVSSGYSYDLTAYCLYGLVFAALGIMCCHAASFFRKPRAERTRRGFVVNLLWGIFFIAAIVLNVTCVDYYNTLEITVYSWRPLESYYRQGFLPSFISEAQAIDPSEPDDYSVEDAEDIIEAYAAAYDEEAEDDEDRAAAEEQFEEDQPTVIVIMNETFSDLSIFEEMHADYEGPSYFNSISDALLTGTLYVSALGGGTANSEFEFLTGTSMAYLGSGVYPYTTYNLTDVENLAQQFSDLGYYTVAMHPNHASNWNRENAYEDMGFDEFLAIEDFEDAETLRGMVTDAATYDTILELLEENDDPMFIFDVTMQNHSGYNTGLIPDELMIELDIDGESDSEVNEYVSLIEQSDEALEEFLEALEELDEEVIVVFFGDHQPFFTDDYNDEWFEDEDDVTHTERVWQTEYVIWANYDVAGCDQTSEELDLSTNYLAAVMMELIGAPLTDYQKAQLVLMEDMPVINSVGYQDSDGVWYAKDEEIDATESEAAEDVALAWENLWKMQYYQLFYDGKDIYTLHTQDEANETDPNLDPGTTLIK